jgi:toxin ParE1/3/4
MRVDFQPDASEQFQASAAYYNNAVPGLGEAFVSEVERITEIIQAQPTIGQTIDEVFRRAVRVRLPFSVIYSIETDGLWVIAVAHPKRLPGY